MKLRRLGEIVVGLGAAVLSAMAVRQLPNTQAEALLRNLQEVRAALTSLGCFDGTPVTIPARQGSAKIRCDGQERAFLSGDIMEIGWPKDLQFTPKKTTAGSMAIWRGGPQMGYSSITPSGEIKIEDKNPRMQGGRYPFDELQNVATDFQYFLDRLRPY